MTTACAGWAGDYRAAVVDATGEEPLVAVAPVVVVVTSTFRATRGAIGPRRSAHRLGYGHVALQLRGRGVAQVAAEVGLGFAEGTSTCCSTSTGAGVAEPPVALGRTEAESPSRRNSGLLDLATVPLSGGDDVPESPHRRGSSLDRGPAAHWRGAVASAAPQPTGLLVELRPLPPTGWISRAPEQIILRRRSTRNYAPTCRSVRGVLHAAGPFDPGGRVGRARPGAPLSDLYLIVNGVAGLGPGHVHNRSTGAVELLHAARSARRRPASRRTRGTRDAQVILYVLTDLPSCLRTSGTGAIAGSAGGALVAANSISRRTPSGWRGRSMSFDDEGSRTSPRTRWQGRHVRRGLRRSPPQR